MNGSVERQAATVEEATAEALRELGLTEADVTIEVLASGRRGFFGGGRPARVRVSPKGGRSPDVNDRPASIREESTPDATKEDGVTESTVDRRAPDAEGHERAGDVEVSPEERLERLDEEADLAADFVEGLLDLLDLPGDIEIEVAEDQALVNVTEVGSGLLIGRRGATLDALQELVRSATQRRTERRAHIRVDVEGYRARQLDKLRAKCRDAIAEVRETGEPVRLEPMDAYERKMMHDLVATTGGVVSSSEGNEPKRRVVIQPEA